MSGLSPAEIIGRCLRRAKYIAEQEDQCRRRYPILRCCKRQAGDHRKKKEKETKSLNFVEDGCRFGAPERRRKL